MDTNARLIWLLDYTVPYFQCGYVVASIVCAAFCFWSATRHFNTGLLLFGILWAISAVQNSCFAASAFQDGQPFFPSIPFELRKQAYLYGRILGPPQLLITPLAVVLLALQNMRGRKI